MTSMVAEAEIHHIMIHYYYQGKQHIQLAFY